MSSAQASEDLLHPPAQTAEPPKKLICIAWFIEVIAILVSLSLAVHPLVTAQDSLLNGWLGAAPFLVIAVAEIAKIPLVEALFRIKGLLLCAVAATGITVICLNTFYTVSNGFERAHNTKTKHIEEVKRDIAHATSEIARINEERAPAKKEMDRIQQELHEIDQRQQKEVNDYWNWAGKIAENKFIAKDSRIDSIRRSYNAQRARLLAEQQKLQAPLALSTSALEAEKNELSHRLNTLTADNQIYRFAAMIYGYNDPAQMTAKELNTFCFVWFGLVAFAVSVLGPFLALCYYRIKYQDTRVRSAWDALLRSARRLLLRLARRNKIVRIEQVERVVETPVEVEVFRDVVHEVPVEKVVVNEVEVVREVPVEKVVVNQVEVVREVPVDRIVVQDVIREVPVDRIVPYERLVEVEKKEIVYVPIFTNDPDVLRAQAA